MGENDVVFGEDVGPGGHYILSAGIDGTLQGLDGFDDLVGLELEGLEMRYWQVRWIKEWPRHGDDYFKEEHGTRRRTCTCPRGKRDSEVETGTQHDPIVSEN